MRKGCCLKDVLNLTLSHHYSYKYYKPDTTLLAGVLIFFSTAELLTFKNYMWMCEVYHLELVSRDAKEHCFCSILQHHWFTFCIFEVPRGILHCLAMCFFGHSQTSSFGGSRDIGEIGQDVGEAPAGRDLHWFQGNSVCLALVGPWVFWCQLKMTSCFWLLSCRPVLLRISQLIQPNKPLETPGLSAGATPLVRAHHCKGKRGYWPNAEHWFFNHWMILVGMCISLQACNSGQWTGMMCFWCFPYFALPFYIGEAADW